MRLTIDHVTLYRYESPVRGVVQSLRLMPTFCDNQHVLAWDVTVPGGTEGAGFRDGAGDRIQAFTVAGPVSEIEVRVKGTVETIDRSGVLSGHREIIPPEAYLRETEATLPDTNITELARAAEGKEDRVAAAHALMNAVADAIEYQPGMTHAATTASEALKIGKGVCQDHAQVMIAAARAAGIPARYVSGYLFTGSWDGEGEQKAAPARSKESGWKSSSKSAGSEPAAAPSGTEAAHAWAELFAPGLGWVGFDAANRWCPDQRYVRLGSGLDALAAAPIRGTSRLGAAEILEVSVDIHAVASGSGQQ